MNASIWWQVLLYACGLVTLIQLFYFLYFFRRLATYQPAVKNVSQTQPVSVIICARDEAANLAKNLPGSLLQSYPTTHEVIVVNDNSFDDSKYLLEALHKEFRQLKVVELTQEAKMIPGKKFPLSVGIKTARYETVLLTDADCVPASEFWIERMQAAYDEGTEIVLGYGPYHRRKGLLNKIIRWETFHTALQYMSYALAGTPYMGVGRNLSYHKRVFFRHKGFSAHNHVPSGDDDLFISMAATKKNTRINIDPQSFTLSEPALTWSQWRRQKHRHYTTAKYYRLHHKLLLGLYSASQFLFYPLLVATALLVSWEVAMAALVLRLLAQAFTFYPAMKKLNESDLFAYFLFFDLWMFFYYLIFATTLVKKPRTAWK